MKKVFFGLVLLLSMCASFTSCTQDNQNGIFDKNQNFKEISKKYYIKINKVTKETIVTEDEGTPLISDYENYVYYVENIFQFNNKYNFKNEKEAIQFFNQNPNLLNGKYSLKIGDNIVYSSDIKNGKELNINKIQLFKVKPCSYEGIRLCAVNEIDNMT
jgi:hypothetical protein